MAVNFDYDSALEQVSSALLAGTSAGKSYIDPPEQLDGSFPCWVLQWISGEGTFITRGATDETGTLVCMLYTSRSILPADVNTARSYIDEFRDTIFNDRTFSGKVLALIGYRFTGPAAFSYGRDAYTGIRFELDLRFSDDP